MEREKRKNKSLQMVMFPHNTNRFEVIIHARIIHESFTAPNGITFVFKSHSKQGWDCRTKTLYVGTPSRTFVTKRTWDSFVEAFDALRDLHIRSQEPNDVCNQVPDEICVFPNPNDSNGCYIWGEVFFDTFETKLSNGQVFKLKNGPKTFLEVDKSGGYVLTVGQDEEAVEFIDIEQEFEIIQGLNLYNNWRLYISGLNINENDIYGIKVGENINSHFNVVGEVKSYLGNIRRDPDDVGIVNNGGFEPISIQRLDALNYLIGGKMPSSRFRCDNGVRIVQSSKLECCQVKQEKSVEWNLSVPESPQSIKFESVEIANLVVKALICCNDYFAQGWSFLQSTAFPFELDGLERSQKYENVMVFYDDSGKPHIMHKSNLLLLKNYLRSLVGRDN